RFVGVARIGLLTNELDAVARSVKRGVDDPHLVALFAVPTEGETASLVARVDPSDRIAPVGDDLRVISERPAAPIAALLASPLIRGLDPEHPTRDGSVMVGDERYLVTIRE